MGEWGSGVTGQFRKKKKLHNFGGNKEIYWIGMKGDKKAHILGDPFIWVGLV